MGVFKSRAVLVALALVLLGGTGAWLLTRDTDDSGAVINVRVKRGEFRVVVTTSGELRARKFVQITAPAGAQQAEIYQMKISTIVPEGTVVKEGDVVAELDRSTLAPKIDEVMLALQRAEAVHEQASLDSTLSLSKAREEIRGMELGLEEKRLARAQAAYEAPTVRRQAEIDLEKAERAWAQAKLDYTTKTEQARAKMREVGADLNRHRNQLRAVQEVMQGFTIRAPAPGMVIYVKEWNGRKRTAGSQVNAWDPGVATLPDLTQMESLTYVNEIDVRKIAVGQPVVLALDSDPTRKLRGKVTDVANVGEQRPNTDAKVFEVKIEVLEPDTTLRPGMTTSNGIETHVSPDVLYLPFEAVFTEEGLSLVYRQSGSRLTRQEVVIGVANDDEVVIERGLKESDLVLLVPPRNAERLPLARLPGSTAGAPAGADTTRVAPPRPAQPPGAGTPPAAAAAAGAVKG